MIYGYLCLKAFLEFLNDSKCLIEPTVRLCTTSMGGPCCSKLARLFGGRSLCGRVSRGDAIPRGEDLVGKMHVGSREQR